MKLKDVVPGAPGAGAAAAEYLRLRASHDDATELALFTIATSCRALVTAARIAVKTKYKEKRLPYAAGASSDLLRKLEDPIGYILAEQARQVARSTVSQRGSLQEVLRCAGLLFPEFPDVPLVLVVWWGDVPGWAPTPAQQKAAARFERERWNGDGTGRPL